MPPFDKKEEYMTIENGSNTRTEHDEECSPLLDIAYSESEISQYLTGLLHHNHCSISIGQMTEEERASILNNTVDDFLYTYDSNQLLRLALDSKGWTIEDIINNRNIPKEQMSEMTGDEWSNITDSTVADFINNIDYDKFLRIASNLMFESYTIAMMRRDIHLFDNETFREYNPWLMGFKDCARIHYLLNPRVAYFDDPWWRILKHLM